MLKKEKEMVEEVKSAPPSKHLTKKEAKREREAKRRKRGEEGGEEGCQGRNPEKVSPRWQHG
jgi:hypothetical protein